jgi:hypothetical protein
LHTEMANPASLTGNDVPRPLSHFGGGRRDVIIDTQPKGDTAATIAIASISDQDWYVSRTHGVYHIPACAKQTGPPGTRQGEAGGSVPYALLLITSRGDVIDLGDNRRFPFTISAREIAEDLLQDLHDHGIFVCAGARPTAEELAAATARRDTYYHRLIGEGDTLWARGHSFREISDMHRRAAMALGIEREWAYVPVRMSECPACGEKVKSGVAVCKHCHAILDAEKAAQHGLGPQRGSDARSGATDHNPAAANVSNEPVARGKGSAVAKPGISG